MQLTDQYVALLNLSFYPIPQLQAAGDLLYFSVSFTFAYQMTMGYSSLFGGYATMVTRIASQVGPVGNP